MIEVYATHPDPPAGIVLRTTWSPNVWWLINDRVVLRGHIAAFVSRRRVFHKIERFSDTEDTEVTHFNLGAVEESDARHTKERFSGGDRVLRHSRGHFYDRCTFDGGNIGLELGTPDALASVVVCYRCVFHACRDYAVYGSPSVFAMIGCRVIGGCAGELIEMDDPTQSYYKGGHGIRFASGGIAVIQKSRIFTIQDEGCYTAVTFRGKGTGWNFSDGCVTDCLTNNILTAEAQNSNAEYNELITDLSFTGNIIRPWVGHPNSRGVVVAGQRASIASNIIEANTGVHLRKKHGRRPSDVEIRDNIVYGTDTDRNQYMIEGSGTGVVFEEANTWKPLHPMTQDSQRWKGTS